ncbi:MAG: DUF4012 domain-containing protein [Patescibacteria group bacterium]|nr:DUF4012 domain-containing protein [Patescibacteria group bacterium]
MGEKSKYYYLKPKSDKHRIAFHEPSSGTTTSRNVAAVSLLTTNHPTSIVDMNFESSQASASLSGMGILRAVLILILAAILYIGGLFIYGGANNLRGQITDLSLRGMDKLAAAAVALTEQDMLAAQGDFLAAENLFATAQKEVLSLGQTNLYLSGLAADRSQIVAGQQLIDSGINLAQAGQIMLDATQPIFQYLNGTSVSTLAVDDFTIQMVTLLQASSADFDRALAKIDRAHTLLVNVNPTIVGTAYASALNEAQTKTARLQELVSILGTLAKELPDALGFKNPRHYLILNQNNNELRATGGFLGSFVWMEIYQGKIQDIKVDITQRVDGQLGHAGDAIMPAPLRAVTTQFGTRDSNWYLDFPTSAQSFQKLYEQGGGGTADGIIAINPTIIEDILKVFGPIYIASKDLEITADNFVETTQQQVELIDNQQENPKEVLTELAPILMERLMSANQGQLQQTYTALLDRIASKDVLLYFNNLRLQQVAHQLNAAGTVAVDGVGDFLSVVQSNLGGTKSSQHLIQDIEHVANINIAGEITDELALTYTHTGTSEFPDGTNKNYLRIYVPLGSQLGDYTGQDYGTTAETFDESGKTVFAFWVTTEPGATSRLTLRYTLPTDVTDDHLYQLYLQKQAGANNTRLSSVVHLSPALQFADGSKHKLLFDDKFIQDANFGVEYIGIN